MKKTLALLLSFMEFIDDTRDIICTIPLTKNRVGNFKSTIRNLHSLHHWKQFKQAVCPAQQSSYSRIFFFEEKFIAAGIPNSVITYENKGNFQNYGCSTYFSYFNSDSGRLRTSKSSSASSIQCLSVELFKKNAAFLNLLLLLLVSNFLEVINHKLL